MNRETVAATRTMKSAIATAVGALLLPAQLVIASPRAWAADGAIVPPQRLDAADAPYPAGASGDATVTLVVVVDGGGEVTEVTVREGTAPFAEAAVAAVHGWRFSPAMKGDTPVASRIVATVTFHAPVEVPRAHVLAPELPSAAVGPAAPKPRDPEPQEVSVRGEREEPGTIHFPRTETRLVAGAFGDPFKVLESLPGTSPWLSGLPYYFVRGAPPETVGYFVDGIRVPLLFHVGPGPSTIAPALVDSVDLFSSAYPARYGRYSGAVIAGETTPPATDRPHGEFSARVYDASAYGELPTSDGKGSVAAASRYAYTGPLISLIVPDYSLDYWDYQLRASHTVGSAGSLTVFAFGAHDELHYKGQPSFRIEYHRLDLRYDRPTRGGNVRVAFTANYDDSLTTVTSDSGAADHAARKGPGWRLRTEVDERVAPRAKVRAGADLGATRFGVDEIPKIGGVASPVGPHTDVEGGAYADLVWRPGPAVEVVPGFRFDGYATRGETAWAPQPRMSAKVGILPRLSWLASVGTAHQEPTEAIFIPGKIPYAVSQGSQNSYQFSQGVEVVLPSSLRARVSSYYARLLAKRVLGTDETQLGESYGLEAFVHRDFTQRLGGFVSYTLGRTNGTVGGVTRRVSWDRTHVISVVGGYDLGRGWRIGARIFFESGRPLAPICLSGCSSPTGPATTYQPSGDLPPFWRVDARLEKRWTYPAGQWLAATLECFNVLAEAEPVGDRSGARPATPTPNDVEVTYQSAIILPTIGLEGGL